ncbi:unnamed protein product, partial [Meganyctiphanes norvegica]
FVYNIKFSYCRSRRTSNSGYFWSKDDAFSQSMNQDNYKITNQDEAIQINTKVILRNDNELLEVCSSNVYLQAGEMNSLRKSSSEGRFTILTIPRVGEEESFLPHIEKDNFDELSQSNESNYYLSHIGGPY